VIYTPVRYFLSIVIVMNVTNQFCNLIIIGLFLDEETIVVTMTEETTKDTTIMDEKVTNKADSNDMDPAVEEPQTAKATLIDAISEENRGT
jgi:hypothetical protein